jgi:hypothetical protein
VAGTKTAKNRTSRNDTPNTPDVSESKIARMKVDELRRELKNRGVKGTEGLKKPELVNKLVKAEVRSAKGGRKKPASRNDTPNTPEVSESKIARMKVSELRTRLEGRGVKGTADMKKPELVKKLVKALTGAKSSAGAKTRAAAKSSAGAKTRTAAKSSAGAKSGSTRRRSPRPPTGRNVPGAAW